MKTVLSILSLLLLTNISFAKTIQIDVPAGLNVVDVSSSVWHSGCGSTVNYLSVVSTENGYIAGTNIGIDHDNEVWENHMPRLIDGRLNCMAMVTTTTKLRFKHSARDAETISVEIPNSMDSENLTIEFSEVQIAH